MGVLAVLALVPHVVLLPPEGPSDLQGLGETCAQAIAASPALEVTRLAPVRLPRTAAERARTELALAAQSYRELSFRDAKEQAERAIALLEPEALADEDFELLVEARLRLALTLLAQRKNGPAQRVLEQAARVRPDAAVTEGDYPPNLVAAFERARATVRLPPAVPATVTARTAIPGVEATVWIDGRPLGRAGAGFVPGDHVVVASAAGHSVVRQSVRLPLAAPLVLTLPPADGVPAGIVVAMALEHGAGRIRIRLRRAEGADSARDVDVAGAPAAARLLAETLAGVPPAVVTGEAGTGAGAHQGAQLATGRGETGPTDGRPPRRAREGGGSVFGTWWFWTITGSVVAAGLFGLAATGRSDPGTDVHLGVTQ